MLQIAFIRARICTVMYKLLVRRKSTFPHIQNMVKVCPTRSAWKPFYYNTITIGEKLDLTSPTPFHNISPSIFRDSLRNDLKICAPKACNLILLQIWIHVLWIHKNCSTSPNWRSQLLGTTGIFPKLYKMLSCDLNDLKLYRPVSNLSLMSKLIEKWAEINTQYVI